MECNNAVYSILLIKDVNQKVGPTTRDKITSCRSPPLFEAS